MENFEIATTEHGPVKGIHKTTCLGVDYISFQGIPYMKAPLGCLRFRDPQPPKPWTVAFNATEEASSYCALNIITKAQEGQENAGIVNVYTKSLKPQKLFPVLIHIHGGAFSRGSSKTEIYGPDYLLEKDVIFCTFNYRLGVFGFLSLDDPSLEVPGNAALKDQLLAIKWIKNNIQHFGGDPKNITLTGQSAGGSSVHFQSLFEQAKGLFQKAIIMSGTSFCKCWSLNPRSHCEKLAEVLARKLGWTGKKEDTKNMLEFLENTPAFDIVAASTTVLSNENEYSDGVLLPFGPCIEPYESENGLHNEDPVLLGRSTWSNEIDIIFTGCSFEGIFRANMKEEVATYYFQNSSAYLAPLKELELQPTDPTAAEYGERLKKLYYGDGSIENQESFLKFSSDFIFWHGIYRAILSRIEFAKNAKTFILRFDVNGALNMYKISKKCAQYKGASHVDDLFYLFKSIYVDVPAKESKEFKVIEKMVGIFTNFAINGSPNCREIEPVTFTPQTKSNELKCVQITENDVTEIELPEVENLKVWNSIYKDHAMPLI